MRYSFAPACIVAAAALVIAVGGPVRASKIGDARRDIAAARYAEAEAALVEIAKSAGVDDKQEALFVLAGLKRSASEAEILYQEVVRLNPSGRWAAAAQIELAKLRFALGEYAAAFGILEEASACRKSDEACYFAGLCAVMLKRFPEARELLTKVKSERHRSWAAIALADVEMALNNRDEACRRYRAIARASRGPTALYRSGECLEESGEMEAARETFREVVTGYKDTPEALLAGEKLSAMRSAAPAETALPVAAEAKPGADGAAALTTGYTLQFGSFSDRANAIKLAAELKRELPGVRIDSDLLRFKEVHRVRYGYFKSRGEAQRRAEEITRQTGEPCAIMPLP